jgi:hypothetical protein
MGCVDHPNQPAQKSILLPGRMRTLKAIVLQKTPGSSARLKGLGVVVSLAIAAAAIFALTHALKNVDYDEVFTVVRRTNLGVIVLALMLVVTSYVNKRPRLTPPSLGGSIAWLADRRRDPTPTNT